MRQWAVALAISATNDTLTRPGFPSRAVVSVRYFYLVVIPLTLGLMLLHNSGDWARKLIGLRAVMHNTPSLFASYGARFCT
jgi:hypothetical protein